ncbi:hypothetical protein WS86_27070 [Burkholderia savannae]|nr:hypothetical protein WS86_27070 [Burkholderia savannae]
MDAVERTNARFAAATRSSARRRDVRGAFSRRMRRASGDRRASASPRQSGPAFHPDQLAASLRRQRRLGSRIRR